MDQRKEILEENFNEYKEGAESAYNQKKYNIATTLFFKAMCAGVDLYILKKENIVPSSHTKRFRIVEEKYPQIYEILDRDFPFYQESYTQKSNKEATEVLREDVKTITKMLKD
ncbi:hypothetical protein CL622_00680 [archaeon]|nr:hypothetical protein [archaeon]|tara:strand:+ start:4029 stop:4367 length:339 start_codon:yes stop_codon:yes gene_type:complete